MRAEINPKRCLIGKLNQAIKKIFPELQQKTATPTEEQQEITADAGVYGLSKVTINRIPQEYIVPSGSIEITENGTYDVTDKASANVEIGGSYPPDWSEIGYEDTPQGIIGAFNYAKEIQSNWDSSIVNMSNRYNPDYNLLFFPQVNTENVNNMRNAFNGSNLVSIPLLNTGKVTSMSGTFRDCKALYSIPPFDLSMCNDVDTMFTGCYNLTDVPVLNIGTKRIGYNVSCYATFSSCKSLSNESLNNIMKTFTNVRTSSSNKTLRNLGLTQAQAETCQSLSNYQAFLDAGWTTGY